MHKNNCHKPKINSQNPEVTLNGFVHPTKRLFHLRRETLNFSPREWQMECLFLSRNMDFKSRNQKIGFARVADKVSNFDLKH